MQYIILIYIVSEITVSSESLEMLLVARWEQCLQDEWIHYCYKKKFSMPKQVLYKKVSSTRVMLVDGKECIGNKKMWPPITGKKSDPAPEWKVSFLSISRGRRGKSDTSVLWCHIWHLCHTKLYVWHCLTTLYDTVLQFCMTQVSYMTL